MGRINDNFKIVAKGHLLLKDKNTGEEIGRSNLVVKNSAHITALALGGDITTTTVKMASWDDGTEEVTSSYYNMVDLEALLPPHSGHAHHVTYETDINGTTYPASRSIKFGFTLDANDSGVQASGIIGKNIREFGLYFNDIMFSRVALASDFVFESWMEVEGEWTIMITGCYGGFASYLLNQYDLVSVWGFNSVSVNGYIEDYTRNNRLDGALESPYLLSDIENESSNIYNVVQEDAKDRDALPIFFLESGVDSIPDYNVLYTLDENQVDIDLEEQFTIWCWHNYIEFDDFTTDTEQVLMSKWVTTGTDSDRSWRLYYERDTDTSGSLYLKFDINNNGTVETVTSSVITPEENQFHLVNVVLDNSTNIVSIYLDGTVVGIGTLSGTVGQVATPTTVDSTFFIGTQQSNTANATSYDTNKIFLGIIDESGISNEAFSKASITAQWNSGSGDFFYE